MLKQSCLEFIDQLSSKEAVPGGGGASALVGAVGMAMGMMVGNLTVGKEKYQDVQNDIQYLLSKSDEIRIRLENLVERDAEAFTPLAYAYRMPSSTAEEKKQKNIVLQEALIDAIDVPMAILQAACDAVVLLADYAQKGNKLAISDAGVGAACCRAAMQGARLNVLINLRMLEDQKLKAEYHEKLKSLYDSGIDLANQVYDLVEACL